MPIFPDDKPIVMEPVGRREDDKAIKTVLLPILKKISDTQDKHSERLTRQEERFDSLKNTVDEMKESIKQHIADEQTHAQVINALQAKQATQAEILSVVVRDVDDLKGSRDRQRGIYKQKESVGKQLTILATVIAGASALGAFIMAFFQK